MLMTGNSIHEFAKKLWPITRSVTGQGVRETLFMIKNEVPELKLFEVPSGTQVFDWHVPKEWDIKDAYIVTPSGKKFVILNKTIFT